MTPEEIDKAIAEGTMQRIEPPVPETPEPQNKPFEIDDYIRLFEMLRVVKRSVSVVPTRAPQNFLEQIVIYKNGVTLRLYVWVDNAWRYVALT